MNKTTRLNLDEKGAGFVESLIAILIAGVATIALLGIAITVIRESKNNEIRDAMSQYAVEGMEKVRWIAASEPSAITEGTYCIIDDSGCSNERAEEGTSYHGFFHKIVLDDDRCSSETGTECGRLTLDRDGNDFFYREIDMEQKTSVVYVTVRVGRLVCPEKVPSEQCRSEITGFVPISN